MAILEAPLVDAMPVESVKSVKSVEQAVDIVEAQAVSSQIKTVLPEVIVPKVLIDVGTTVERTFACHKHIRPAQFPEAGLLPFPRDVKKLAAWADAFVEQLGWLAVQQSAQSANFEAKFNSAQSENSKLNKQILDLKNQLALVNKENRTLQQKNTALSSHNNSLLTRVAQDEKLLKEAGEELGARQIEICAHLRKIEKQKRKIAKMHEKYLREIEGDEQKIAELQEILRLDALQDAERESLLESLQKDVAKATKEIADLKEQAKAEKLLLETAKGEVESLTQHLASLQEELDKANKELSEVHHDLDVEKGKVAQLELNLSLAQTKANQAEDEIKSLNTKIQEAEDREKAALANVQTVKDHAQMHWNTLQNIREQGGWERTDKGDECDPVMPQIYY